MSDITALAKDKAYARISLDDISIHQVVRLTIPTGKYEQLNTRFRVVYHRILAT
ncbi:unnamed protein product [Lupinus luteus]|uniref:Uncharacterized protein n=1 Tax=Lupinus luteus TaxID=3873 RepID=A0AAV1VYU5_LUPLU